MHAIILYIVLVLAGYYTLALYAQNLSYYAMLLCSQNHIIMPTSRNHYALIMLITNSYKPLTLSHDLYDVFKVKWVFLDFKDTFHFGTIIISYVEVLELISISRKNYGFVL